MIERQIERLMRQMDDILVRIARLEKTEEVTARLTRIEQLLVLMSRGIAKEDKLLMAQRATLDRMNATVTAMKSTVEGAKTAFEHYATQHADDLQKLKDALANDDETEVAAAVAQMESTQKDLTDAIPATAAAIAANTEAAA